MSKASDNEALAKLLQGHLAKQGHYLGAIDGWAGQVTVSAWRASIGLDPIPTSPIVVPVIVPGNPHLSDLPTPDAMYRLPAETNAAMSSRSAGVSEFGARRRTLVKSVSGPAVSGRNDNRETMPGTPGATAM